MAAQQQTLKSQVNERDEKKKLLEKSEAKLDNVNIMGCRIGNILQKLDEETFLIKVGGPRYVSNICPKLDINKAKTGTRIYIDAQTHTIMGFLPREVDPSVQNMSAENPGEVKFTDVGGLTGQIRELREAIELPLTNPELFARVGIKPPKGCLLYGPPGTGKTLLARVLANEVDAKYIKCVASQIVDKYIGESARVVRDLFAFAKDNQPAIIFIDEIDAIGGKRLGEGSSADREVQRTLMELLN